MSKFAPVTSTQVVNLDLVTYCEKREDFGEVYLHLVGTDEVIILTLEEYSRFLNKYVFMVGEGA